MSKILEVDGPDPFHIIQFILYKQTIQTWARSFSPYKGVSDFLVSGNKNRTLYIYATF